MAVRITGAVQGLPEAPVSPKCRVPVRPFQADLRRLFTARRVLNTVAFPPGDGTTPPRRSGPNGRGRPSGLVGQPELSRALRDAVAARLAGERAVRLLIAGLEGTGKGTAAEIAEEMP